MVSLSCHCLNNTFRKSKRSLTALLALRRNTVGSSDSVSFSHSFVDDDFEADSEIDTTVVNTTVNTTMHSQQSAQSLRESQTSIVRSSLEVESELEEGSTVKDNVVSGDEADSVTEEISEELPNDEISEHISDPLSSETPSQKDPTVQTSSSYYGSEFDESDHSEATWVSLVEVSYVVLPLLCSPRAKLRGLAFQSHVEFFSGFTPYQSRCQMPPSRMGVFLQQLLSGSSWPNSTYLRQWTIRYRCSADVYR